MLAVSKYNRISVIYDLIEMPVEIFLYGKWRKEALSNLKGRVLEAGVGTGRNLEYYPAGTQVTGIDNSKGMLDKAREKARRMKNVNLLLMDAEHMEFPDNTFDYVVTTFVLCSIPDPVKALKEMRRVLKPSGELIALEHMRSKSPLIARIEDLINPIMFFLIGDELNRNTVDNIKKVGLLSRKKLIWLLRTFSKRSGQNRKRFYSEHFNYNINARKDIRIIRSIKI